MGESGKDNTMTHTNHHLTKNKKRFMWVPGRTVEKTKKKRRYMISGEKRKKKRSSNIAEMKFVPAQIAFTSWNF